MPVEIKELYIRVRVVDDHEKSQRTASSQTSSAKKEKMVEKAFGKIAAVLEEKTDAEKD